MYDDHESKSLRLELKADGDEGAFRATFATLNVIDHHGDVTLPGAFEPGKEVLVGAYQHEMFNLPVGKAVLAADDERAWIDGHFFLDTTPGMDTYRTVKNAGGLMEWSYIFTVKDSSDGDFDTGAGIVPVRFLKKLDVWSVDPVLKGAGIGTRTDAIKGLGQPFAEQGEGTIAAVAAFVKRAEARLEMRAKGGRSLSADDRERVTALVTGLADLKARLEEALREPASLEQNIDLQREYLLYQRGMALVAGVALPA